MLRFAICDDESIIYVQLEKMIERISQNYSKKIEIEVFFSGEKLYQFMCEGACFDIVFLDIELPQINGIDIGKKIRDEMHDEITKIVYISGKDSYAMDLFDVRPLNFLIKYEEQLLLLVNLLIDVEYIYINKEVLTSSIH